MRYMENKKTYNVIIDTNVIVAAFLSPNDDSKTAQVMNLFYDKKINLYYSSDILNEYIDVLHREKFNFDAKIIDRFIDIVKQNAMYIEPENIDIEMIDFKDKPFYELLLDKNVGDGKLITGNLRHFPNKINIVTPAEFMDIYLSAK